MDYVLMFYEPAEAFGERTSPETAGPYWGAWSAYIQALQASGLVKGGAGLQPPRAAATVRLKDGRRHVQDGPFAETKEQLGGFFLIDAPSLDVALEWAARSPAASYGSVEVRPVMPPMQAGSGPAG
ncbi:YciI family protein [Alsobacter sp. SYSU BS001988]